MSEIDIETVLEEMNLEGNQGEGMDEEEGFREMKERQRWCRVQDARKELVLTD